MRTKTHKYKKKGHGVLVFTSVADIATELIFGLDLA